MEEDGRKRRCTLARVRSRAPGRGSLRDARIGSDLRRDAEEREDEAEGEGQDEEAHDGEEDRP